MQSVIFNQKAKVFLLFLAVLSVLCGPVDAKLFRRRRRARVNTGGGSSQPVAGEAPPPSTLNVSLGGGSSNP